MPRRGNVPKREVLPDPVYGDIVVAKLINSIMLDGKKGVAQNIVYSAFDNIKAATGEEPMDVFEKADAADKTTATSPSLKERLQNTGKLLASAWVGTINKFSSLKTNAIAFGNKIKDTTIAAAKKIQEISNKEIDLNVFKYNVSRLQNQPVSELRTMLSNELQGVTNEQ